MMNAEQPSEDLASVAREIRRTILEMAFRSKTGHVGSAFSITDILTVLYFRVMNMRPLDPQWSDRDRFLLSKGHAAAALYATLATKGIFPMDDLKQYCVDGGIFHGHPCRYAAPGIEISTGSLGHGLSIAAGIALGLGEQSQTTVFTLLGDGECNEGSVWEAANFIATHQLHQVVAIIDRNRFQGFGPTETVQPLQLMKLWEACGWETMEVDGHDLVAVEAALIRAKSSQRPTAIIANTIAGKGIRAIEGTLEAHYRNFDQEAFDQALSDIYAQ